MIAESLAHYRIIKKLGSGGMGEVFLAQDSKLDRKVAIKVLAAESHSLTPGSGVEVARAY
jgi:serine/threonine protein kinase